MRNSTRTTDICYIAMGAVIICLTAWITIPTVVPFTLQTLGVFVVLRVLGGRRGTLCVMLYLTLGLIGLPVFSGFSGGPGVLVSITGGYLIGFLLMSLLYWCLTKTMRLVCSIENIALIAGLLVCYMFGSIWLACFYGGIDFFKKALVVGVLPFVIPDLIKLVVSAVIARLMKKHIRI